MAQEKKRLKAAAASYAAQTKEEVISGIKRLGDIQRELTRIETEMNDQIATVTEYRSPVIEQLKAKRDELQGGITIKKDIENFAMIPFEQEVG